MNWWEMAFAIPLSAIVLGVGGEMMKTILKSREKQLELRLKAQQEQSKRASKGDGDVLRQLEALRAEIASLRDTTTQFDLTTDHAMQRLEERLSRLETRTASRTVTEEPHQTLTQR